MDSSTYRHIMGQIKKSCIIPHSSFPSHNLISLEALLKVSKNLGNIENDFNFTEGGQEFFETIPCYKPFDYHVESTWPFYCGYGLSDISIDLVKKKSEWEKKLKKLRISNLKKAVKCIKDLQANTSTKLSTNLAQYIEHFHNDPEPSFQGNYNWLYTGGNILGVETDSSVLLITADYFNKRSGYNILKMNEDLNEIEYKTTVHLKTYLPVLQISGQCKEDYIYICVRQKNSAALFKLNSIDNLSYPTKLWRKKISEYKSLTCIDVNKNCEEVVIADSTSNIHVYDVETKIKKFGLNIKSRARDAWNQVIYSDSGISFVDRNSFVILDSRENCTIPKLKYSLSSATNICEDICSITKSSSDCNYLYFGTTHCLIQMDIRNWKIVQKWTHLMKDSPLFVKSTKDNNGDFIVLQSQQTDETIGVTNKCLVDGNNVNFLSNSLPCFIGGVKESLKTARYNELCLSPMVAKRFDFSVTGVCCFKSKKGKIHLFIGNSGGDVFLTKLKKTTSQIDTEDPKTKTLNFMKAYENQLEKMMPISANWEPAEIVDMKHVLDDLQSSKLMSKNYKQPTLLWKYNEMFDPESLMFYKDVLAEKILKVWGFPSNECEFNTTMPSDMKVREWMEKFNN